MNWPIYGQIAHIEKPDFESKQNFYVQSRNIYVDFPNQFIRRAIDEIVEAQQQFPDDSQKQLKAGRESAEESTESFYQYYNHICEQWLNVIVVDTMELYGYYGIQIRPKWDQFQLFLDKFAQSDFDLVEKYNYLRNSRDVAIEIASKASDPLDSVSATQNAVREIAQGDLSIIDNQMQRITRYLVEYRDDLFTYSKRKTVLDLPAVLRYMMEMLTILSNLDTLAEEGSVSSCYRELRKLLENLCWAIFHDFLTSNSAYSEYFKENPEIPGAPASYLHLNQQWYKWDDISLRSWTDVQNEIHHIRDQIHVYLDEIGYDVHKGKITVAVREMMSYPLFLTLTGRHLNESEVRDEDVENFVVPWSNQDLQPLVNRTLRSILRETKGRRLYKKDQNFVDEMSKDLTGFQEHKFIVPAFPSNSFIIDYVDHVFGVPDYNMDDIYGDYSYFVHSYRDSWQVYPFSSVLEFKILKNEINRFGTSLQGLMQNYVDHCY